MHIEHELPEPVADYPYKSITSDIEVQVNPIYLEDESDSLDHEHVWAYFIRIRNRSKSKVRLMARHWEITDSNGHKEEVNGSGVIGEQPVLNPGEVFEYNSFTMLPTPSGIMVGSYHMMDTNGQSFNVEVPAFSLDAPGMFIRLN